MAGRSRSPLPPRQLGNRKYCEDLEATYHHIPDDWYMVDEKAIVGELMDLDKKTHHRNQPAGVGFTFRNVAKTIGDAVGIAPKDVSDLAPVTDNNVVQIVSDVLGAVVALSPR